jgi:hypothetical protein
MRVCACACVCVQATTEGGKNSANATKQRQEAVVERDTAQEKLAAQAGQHTLAHWGTQISDGGRRGGKKFDTWWKCLFEVDRVHCPWEGTKQNLKKHLEGSIVKAQGTQGGNHCLVGHGLKISS